MPIRHYVHEGGQSIQSIVLEIGDKPQQGWNW